MSIALSEAELEAAYESIKSIDLPVIPEAVQQSNMELSKPDPDLVTLTRLISKDVVLSGEVVRIVNSPFFGLTREISSIQQAVMLLGTHKLKSLLIMAALRKALNKNTPAHRMYWKQTAAVAACAAGLSEMIHDMSPEKAYMAGLFMDAGMLVLLESTPAYQNLMNVDSLYTAEILDEEQTRFGTHHATIGYLLCLNWNVPTEISLAVLYHHTQDYSLIENDELRSLIAMLQLSNSLIAEHFGNGIREHKDFWPTRERALNELMISNEIAQEIGIEFISQMV